MLTSIILTLIQFILVCNFTYKIVVRLLFQFCQLSVVKVGPGGTFVCSFSVCLHPQHDLCKERATNVFVLFSLLQDK